MFGTVGKQFGVNKCFECCTVLCHTTQMSYFVSSPLCHTPLRFCLIPKCFVVLHKLINICSSFKKYCMLQFILVLMYMYYNDIFVIKEPFFLFHILPTFIPFLSVKTV